MPGIHDTSFLTPGERKKALRLEMQALRSGLNEQEKRSKSENICMYMVEGLEVLRRTRQEPLTVCGYMPIRSEAEVSPVLEWCWTSGVRLLLPRVDRRTGGLSLYETSGYGDLESGSWGIREPKTTLPRAYASDAAEPARPCADVLLVPGLAFDRRMGRLGYGGGYYDRLLDRMAQRLQPLKLAAAYDLQIVESVPMEEHDWRMDQVVTESGPLRPGPMLGLP